MNFRTLSWQVRLGTACVALILSLAATAQEGARQLFQGQQVQPPSDRLHIQTEGNLTVATAVPSREETEAVFGMDLYKKNIQPVWVQVENRSENTVYLTPMGLDPGYFTPREAAERSRPDPLTEHSEKFEQRSHGALWVAPKSIQSGYIFSRVDEGTKSFNVDIIGDGQAHMMTFFVPVPGLRLDHHEVDIPGMYPESELVHIDSLEQLTAELEAMPCCVRDAKGKDKGDPLNLVFIGEIMDMYYAFMRKRFEKPVGEV